MVKADLHNHLRTSEMVLDGDLYRAVRVASKKLGKGAVVGIANNKYDWRYERLLCLEGPHWEFVEKDGSVVHFPEEEVYFVKGHEVKTNQGNLLVLGLPRGVQLAYGKSLEDTIISAQEEGGIIVGSNMLHKDGIWKYLTLNSHLLNDLDGIEVYNSKAGFPCSFNPCIGNANDASSDFYEKRIQKKYPRLGALSSSDGNSFYEIGLSYTVLPEPDKSNFKEWLRDAIHNTNLETERKNRVSILGTIDHAASSFFIKKFGYKFGIA